MTGELVPKTYKMSACELRTLEGAPLATGYVERIGRTYLQIRDLTERIPPLHATARVQLNLYHKELGSLRLVGRVSSCTGARVRLVSLSPFEDYERRRYFRVDVDLSATLFLPQGGGPERRLPVRVRSLSLCGLMFVYDGALAVGDAVELCLPFISHIAPRLHCVVRRQLEFEGRPGYGCDILEQEDAVVDGLCAFLFEKQREQIRRSRGDEPHE